VQGLALGAGLALASCCDILVASEKARFGIPEVKVGVVGGASFLSRMLPQQLHRYMAYSGDMIMAEQMKQYGAVLKVVQDDQLLISAMDIVDHILNNPPLTLKGFKLAMNKNEDARLDKKYGLEAELGRDLMYKTEDLQEALDAFLNKRKPVYKGR
jgi:enoyl-CoA hydratase